MSGRCGGADEQTRARGRLRRARRYPSYARTAAARGRAREFVLTEKAIVAYLDRSLDERTARRAGSAGCLPGGPASTQVFAEAAAGLGDVVRGGRDAGTRRVALQTLAAGAALDDAVADAAWRDPEWETRRLAAQLGADLAGGDRRARQALNDASPQVRFEVVRTIGQRERIPCGPITELVRRSGSARGETRAPDARGAVRRRSYATAGPSGGRRRTRRRTRSEGLAPGCCRARLLRLGVRHHPGCCPAVTIVRACAGHRASACARRALAASHARGAARRLTARSRHAAAACSRLAPERPHGGDRAARRDEKRRGRRCDDRGAFSGRLSARHDRGARAEGPGAPRCRERAPRGLRPSERQEERHGSRSAAAIRDTLAAGGVDVTVPFAFPEGGAVQPARARGSAARPLQRSSRSSRADE